VGKLLEAGGELEEDPDSNGQAALESTHSDSENDTETKDLKGKFATD
jgi:hypothetical protein